MAQITTDSIQVVTFSLVNQSSGKKENYAVSIEQVKEIRTIEEITKVPKAKSHVKGVMNLRGLIIPVIDVKDKLGFGSTELTKESTQRILVADVKNSLYGLLVDDVDQVMRISSQDIGSAPPGAFENYAYVKGIAKTNDDLIVILDVEPLIGDANIESTNSSDVSHNNNSLDNQNSDISTDETSNNESNNPKSSEHVTDDIPDELQAVFKEDQDGVPPTEFPQEETIASSDQNFQSLVDEESEKIHASSLQS